jgi:AraC-like DNA-binding protein
MNLIHTFKGNDINDYLRQVAAKMGVEIVDDSLQIPPHLGSGFIKNIVIEPGFCIRYFNFTFKKDIEFEIFSPVPENELIYKLLFNLDRYTYPKNPVDDFHSNQTNALLYSTGFVRKGHINKFVNFRRVALIFNAGWLENNYNEAGSKTKCLVQNLITKEKSTVISENLDLKNREILKQLAEELDKPIITMMHIKTAGYILLNDFLNKITRRDKTDLATDQTLHYYTIIKIEDRIMKSINRKLPNIEKLATEFNLSVSTMKRHFRIVFGKSIYQYYQEKRMEWGKTELEKGQRNITMIATSLGFYKINNFSKAFKKQYGILPSKLKAQQMNSMQLNQERS